jgi:hypothetical protein
MTEKQIEDSRSLEEIEDRHWGEPPADATRLIETIYSLRRKPVGSLDVEDLRVLLLQKEGIDVLVPRALDKLAHDPLLEGDLYPGDLLAAVLKIPSSYWTLHAEQAQAVKRVVETVAKMGDLNEYDAPHDAIWEKINEFRV